MSHEIKLDVFEGPLDLLLHLIYRNEVSITDIPIALITEQYLETIDLMKSLNLDVAGEYLVMAAYLTHIKSQMLLPSGGDSEGEEEGGEDPRDELVAHLLEYKRYKEAARELSSFPLLELDVFVREETCDTDEDTRVLQPLNVGIGELVAAFRDLLRRTTRRDLIELEPDRLSVKEKITEIMDRLKRREWITFGSLFDADASRTNLLTTFLALLEVVKLQLVRVYQDKPFGTILISKRVNETDKGEDSPAGEAPAETNGQSLG